MPRVRTRYVCRECGQELSKWMGRCPACQAWNSVAEEVPPSAVSAPGALPAALRNVPRPLDELAAEREARHPTTLSELDRVLGGGLVPGAVILVGGEPGTGKSTLLLQAAWRFAEREGPVLYVSGEESAAQVSLRARRLGLSSDQLLVLAETDVAQILGHVRASPPALLVVDSVQTVACPDLEAGPGSLAQVREAAGRLAAWAKATGVPLLLVGHVNKQGAIAGPKVLEHAVDAVLYLEGEDHTPYRILRSVKNRFGSTYEVGIFEMGERGLAEVADPSAALLSQRPAGAPGSVVAAVLEGTRPLLVEIQALVAPAPFGGTPRRQFSGVDHARTSIVLAVLERRCGVALQTRDVYVNVAGGVRVDEPAADLAIALAITSAARGLALPGDMAAFGEVGLAGEVRAAPRAAERVREAAKLGYSRCLAPAGSQGGAEAVGSVAEALARALGP